MKEAPVFLVLSRRNLLTLLNKLNRNKVTPGASLCLIVKHGTYHPIYPQSHPTIYVEAAEDEEYYAEREPGEVLAEDEPGRERVN
jgi:hypothetical protein